MEGTVKIDISSSVQQKCRPQGGTPTASPAERVAVGSEEIPCPAKKPRRKAGFLAKQGIFELAEMERFELSRRF